ncbi:conserved hypothetical protein [Clostridiaceae bacterium BL-3]|nr:conserved hypothetical protein [Clostridiaceae bacterium BL-3]
MTEYTLAQMIDKLGRNPNLKFQFVEDEIYKENGNGIVIALDEDGRVINEAGRPILSNFSLSSKFRLVNEPVSVKEAFKAFEEGKTIYCDNEGIRYYYEPELLGRCTVLKNQFSKAISVQELLYGKWFIKEDD